MASGVVLVFGCFLRRIGQPKSPERVLRVEQLFAAVLLAGRDVFGVLLGSGGRFTGLKMASCLLGAFSCTLLKSTSDERKFNFLARVEW